MEGVLLGPRYEAGGYHCQGVRRHADMCIASTTQYGVIRNSYIKHYIILITLNVSLFSAVYAKCPYYSVLYMQSVPSMECFVCKVGSHAAYFSSGADTTCSSVPHTTVRSLECFTFEEKPTKKQVRFVHKTLTCVTLPLKHPITRN